MAHNLLEEWEHSFFKEKIIHYYKNKHLNKGQPVDNLFKILIVLSSIESWIKDKQSKAVIIKHFSSWSHANNGIPSHHASTDIILTFL